MAEYKVSDFGEVNGILINSKMRTVKACFSNNGFELIIWFAGAPTIRIIAGLNGSNLIKLTKTAYFAQGWFKNTAHLEKWINQNLELILDPKNDEIHDFGGIIIF